MPCSEAEAFFSGKAWQDWRTAREQSAKLQAGIADRLNNVIRGTNAIVKTLAAIGRR
jgi:hypothetical protein